MYLYIFIRAISFNGLYDLRIEPEDGTFTSKATAKMINLKSDNDFSSNKLIFKSEAVVACRYNLHYKTDVSEN